MVRVAQEYGNLLLSFLLSFRALDRNPDDYNPGGPGDQ